MEQFLDFLINRKFRQSVLCHDAIALSRVPRPEVLAGLSVASQPQAPARRAVFSDERLTRAALDQLSAIWPRALPFEALLEAARSRLDPAPGRDAAGAGGDARVLATDLLRCHRLNLVTLHTHVPPFVLEIGERPSPAPWRASRPQLAPRFSGGPNRSSRLLMKWCARMGVAPASRQVCSNGRFVVIGELDMISPSTSFQAAQSSPGRTTFTAN
jgi:hypothetical protein